MDEDFGSNFDLGSFEDINAVDLGNFNDAGNNLDFGSNFDLGSFEDLAAVDGLNNFDFGSNFDLGSFEDLAAADALNNDLANTDWKALYASDLTPEQARIQNALSDLPSQDFGESAKQYLEDPTNVGNYDDKGFSSGWQKVGTDRVMIRDDGTGIGMKSDGSSYALTKNQVDQMIKDKKLNTADSGYVSATGGRGDIPGGGTKVNNNTYITPDGRIVNTGSGGGGMGGGVAMGGKQDNSMLMMLMMLMMMMNQNKGGGGGTIPALSASQTQLPYGGSQTQTQTQGQPANYRPGQGGITYFNPVQYTPKMAGGGGIGDLQNGRLLRGPGDGVSDSIPATIGGFAGGGQPARLARGEYVMDARTVAALGNGSTDAGAERLDAMRKKILSSDRKAGIGKDSKAYRHLFA